MLKLKFPTHIFLLPLIFLIACSSPDKSDTIKEIEMAELLFQKMVADSGMAKAFVHFADENAVLNRNDSLIIGKESIKKYFAKQSLLSSTLLWTPDFIEVSESGDLAYTYGTYRYRYFDRTGEIQRASGVFHTVWKRQADGSWKYVWD